jgi:hypothetical protein
MLFKLFALLSTPLVAAMPQSVASSPDPAMLLIMSNFHAHTTQSNLSCGNWTSGNWTNFSITDPAQANSFICTYQCSDPLSEPNTWHKCKQSKGKGVDVAFQSSDDLREVGIKKGWTNSEG